MVIHIAELSAVGASDPTRRGTGLLRVLILALGICLAVITTLLSALLLPRAIEHFAGGSRAAAAALADAVRLHVPIP